MIDKSKTHPRDAYTPHNRVQVVRGGKAYFDQIEKIASSAKYTLHLQTYIYDEDETGNVVAEALLAAAARGVHVYMMVDGYASQGLSVTFVKKLQNGGVNFRFFKPLWRSRYYYLGRRMHHKIIVADATVAMVGGLNISNRYNDMPDTAAWLDWAVVAEGPVANGVNKVCEQMWNRAVFRQDCVSYAGEVKKTNCNSLVRWRRNDWVYKKTDITRSYMELFAQAQHSVTVMTSYFWPPQRLLRTMEAAAKRGVTIKVILTGEADVPLVKYAERYLYNRLYRSNIGIYEYIPNVLHGKMGVCDSEWMTLGSYNLNNISAFASIELNMDVKDPEIATEVMSAVNDIITNDCRQVTKENYDAPLNLYKKLLYYLSYRTIHTLFFLFTFYFTQQHKHR